MTRKPRPWDSIADPAERALSLLGPQVDDVALARERIKYLAKKVPTLREAAPLTTVAALSKSLRKGAESLGAAGETIETADDLLRAVLLGSIGRIPGFHWAELSIEHQRFLGLIYAVARDLFSECRDLKDDQIGPDAIIEAWEEVSKAMKGGARTAARFADVLETQHPRSNADAILFGTNLQHFLADAASIFELARGKGKASPKVDSLFGKFVAAIYEAGGGDPLAQGQGLERPLRAWGAARRG